MARIPLVRMLEWLGGNEVRLFFSSGKIVEVALPVDDARGAKVVDGGLGIDPGDGLEISAWDLSRVEGRVLAPGRRGWEGSSPPAHRRTDRRRESVSR